MYYVFIQDGKISGKGQCYATGEGLVCVEVTEDIYNLLDHYIWDGEQLVKNPNYEQEHYEKLCEEVDEARIEYRHAHIDDKTIRRMRKTANGTWTEEDEAEYLALDAEVTAYIEENLPYPTDPITQE